MAGITSLSSRRIWFSLVDSRHSNGLRSYDSTVIWVILYTPLSEFSIDSIGQVAISSMKTSLGFLWSNPSGRNEELAEFAKHRLDSRLHATQTSRRKAVQWRHQQKLG